MKHKKLLKKPNIYLIISIAVMAGFLLCAVFAFRDAFPRTITGFVNFGTSCAYFFCKMFSVKSNIKPGIIQQLPRAPKDIGIPEKPAEFKTDAGDFWNAFISADNFGGYLASVANVLMIIIKVLVLLLPVAVILMIVIKRYFESYNNHYNKDTKPLKLWKKASSLTHTPVKKFVTSYRDYLKEHTIFLKIWLLIWLYNFKLIAVIVNFIAFYLYFSVSFDVANVYVQFFNLFEDLRILFRYMPWPVFLVLVVILLDGFRKNRGYANLQHIELRNRGFINELPISSMIVGTMGKKKTTMLTDIALSLEILMRNKAYELLLADDLKFPHFPWINLENELKKEIAAHRIYNLATCKRYIRQIRRLFDLIQDEKVRRKWEKHCKKVQRTYIDCCFGYEYHKFGLQFADGLKVSGLFDVLEEYAELYFIYVLRCSLIVSNYSIRTDFEKMDAGNFPMWQDDFFKKAARGMEERSRHSHILDFDMLRLGRKIIEDNIKSNSFDFGIIAITEIAKERGNQYDTNELKKKDVETNQKNDLFDNWLKLSRHPGTVGNYPFIKVVMDDQREDSLGANTRQLCDIVHIVEGSEMRLAMPWFWLEEMIYERMYARFLRVYQKYRFRRGDNTLIMYLYKSLMAKFAAYYMRLYNTFGYSVLTIEKERGTKDGEREAKKYYLSCKKIWSRRFATDCFSEYFGEKALDAPLGMPDFGEYETERANASELREQNSYFIIDLYEMGSSKPEPVDEKASKEAAEAAAKEKALELARKVLADRKDNSAFWEDFTTREEEYKLADKLIKYGYINKKGGLG